MSRTVRGRGVRRTGPIYRTLVDEIAGLIERGALRPGDRLPSVRSYARQRRVSVSTVLRVYQVLEDRGQLEVRPQSGHFVAAGRTPLPPVPSPGRVSRGREEVRLTDLVWLLYSQLMDPTLVPFGPATAAPEHYPSRGSAASSHGSPASWGRTLSCMATRTERSSCGTRSSGGRWRPATRSSPTR